MTTHPTFSPPSRFHQSNRRATGSSILPHAMLFLQSPRHSPASSLSFRSLLAETRIFFCLKLTDGERSKSCRDLLAIRWRWKSMKRDDRTEMRCVVNNRSQAHVQHSFRAVVKVFAARIGNLVVRGRTNFYHVIVVGLDFTKYSW